MKIELNRGRKIVLLQWLKQGYINTLDMPECYEGGNVFLELMKETTDE